MSLKRKLVVNSFESAKAVIEELIERIEALEKAAKISYHANNKAQRALGHSMHNMSGDVTDANRKISQFSKK